MSVTVDWWTKTIQVDKLWLTEIQTVPTEIRELNINDFRLLLRALEAGVEGVIWKHTHNHTASVTVGGVELARVVEIVNDYTVTFEDGQYAVNIVGGNSNIGDRVNVNQVSVRSANSAGLITSEAIEYGAFGGGVHIDVQNDVIGTVYPRGTPRMPVNNLDDAQLIATVRGFNELHIVGDIEFTNGDNVDGYMICGEGHEFSVITFSGAVSTDNTIIKDCLVQGGLDGNDVHIYDSHIGVLTGFNGDMFQCLLEDTVTLTGTSDCHFIQCVSAVPGSGTPVIDMGGSGRGLGIRAYAGGLKIINKSGSEPISVDFISGQLKLASTVTAGEIVVRGAGWISEPYQTGTTTIRDDGLINVDVIWDEVMADHLTVGTTGKQLYDGGAGGGGDPDAIADAVWDELLDEHLESGSTGEALKGNKRVPAP